MGDREEPTAGAPAEEMGPADQAADIVGTTAPAVDDGNESGAARPDGRREDPAERVVELERELHERREDLLRERAEVENFKRRMQREKSEALRFALEPFLRDLLPVVDNLERALEHGESASLLDGIKLVHKGLLDALERNGVARLETVGTPFDPSLHEAISQAESAEFAPGAVMAQHQPGYKLHDRLVRPAMVTVNARKAEAPVESGENSD